MYFVLGLMLSIFMIDEADFVGWDDRTRDRSLSAVSLVAYIVLFYPATRLFAARLRSINRSPAWALLISLSALAPDIAGLMKLQSDVTNWLLVPFLLALAWLMIGKSWSLNIRSG